MGNARRYISMSRTREKSLAKVVFKPVDTEEEKSRALKEIMKGSSKGEEETIFLLTPQEFSKVFSPERLRLLVLLRKRPELTISEISSALSRKREAVSRDIRFFEGLGLIELRKQSRTRVPKRAVQEILIEL